MPNFLSNLKSGFVPGWQYAVGDARSNPKQWGFSRSAIWNRAPATEYAGMNPTQQVGFVGGRIAGDALGLGSRSLIWRLHPADLAGTGAMSATQAVGGNRSAQVLGLAAATTALDLGSGNINYFNPGEAGRTAGFAATVPDPDDPRVSENAALEYVNRAVLGRTGRLLPWQEFHEERPDVPYETYAAYQDYLRDPGMLLGVAKGTWDGIDGPEARIMGYRVTPAGALAAAGAIGGAVLATKRFAGLRK